MSATSPKKTSSPHHPASPVFPYRRQLDDKDDIYLHSPAERKNTTAAKLVANRGRSV
ncbi:hypothetical protein AGABI1DRAFT_129323 [Agaricus bisporus var. burnettii JB137-S8]|uniref:Uncharacterized protein n=1 Tax=Agaricus bisporus var. burnettii (strain JB137-S8 / ATCC MYA-4627 / FGSC 10392) TaxID=597362 RepID=K5VUQ1_AGABU|nr:uncharacterized protein AGABI1DRAFT_129323 [Agaricus bisporus var. burnettii JB137-S8]EKM78194.1 hypothetical protein AGABI1DRAFT_129323 [Agaricus bisporus var. burnettii JB137-S8]